MLRFITKQRSGFGRFTFADKKEIKKLTLKEEYKKVWNICKPELPKYMFNSVLTLIHAGMFMYLPNIYGDLTYLMSLKLSTVPATEIYTAYLMMTSKWAVLFGALGALTYRRR
jgi:hypothetical protein